jgi:hypothetical protein
MVQCPQSDHGSMWLPDTVLVLNMANLENGTHGFIPRESTVRSVLIPVARIVTRIVSGESQRPS